MFDNIHEQKAYHSEAETRAAQESVDASANFTQTGAIQPGLKDGGVSRRLMDRQGVEENLKDYALTE